MAKTRINEEFIQEFMDMLTGGELPHGMTMKEQPKLSNQAAFAVIWYLQEHLCVIPPNFEMCDYREGVFDSNYGGHIVSDKYDSWYEKMGIPKELVVSAALNSKSFCCESCEAAYFEEVLSDSDQQAPTEAQ
jgi:hypothetical protein